MKKTLTIGMCTYDDFDGVYFSLQALRMYHGHIVNNDDVELLIIDNNPNGKHSEHVKGLVNWCKNARYLEYTDKKSTSSRDQIFKNAEGKYTISMDCHVFFEPGALDTLIDYYVDNKNCKDIVSGPLIYDNLTSKSTHFKPTWGGDMYGQWETNKQGLEDGVPFEIEMMGLGSFSCETKNWVGFNKRFRGFGAEEGYIHEKFRQNGGKAICLPKFGWMHRFGRPYGIDYPLELSDRIWNYFVGWLELTQDPEHQMIKDIYENFKDRIPVSLLDNILSQAKKQELGVLQNV